MKILDRPPGQIPVIDYGPYFAGRDIIHAVTNPLSRLTGAIDVYGGDFFAASRSEWDPETLFEPPFDMEKTYDCSKTRRPDPFRFEQGPDAKPLNSARSLHAMQSVIG